ncbi:hypothetical protein FRB99_006546 [Tulasnella sp. 403]|nr:hypothetical protein FRB99_006546 [Tulasnella sp. 403]
MNAQPITLTPKVRLGLLFVVLVAVQSFLAVSSLLLYICYNALRNRYWSRTPGVEKWYFFRSHVDYYFLSLLISDLIMSTGSMMTAAWVITANGNVPRGAYCSAQGAIKQVGNVGTALATLVIAVHTFSVLVLRWRPSDDLRLPLAVIAIIWLFLLCISAIPGNILDHYYGPSTYWCWIEAHWFGQRLGLEYALYWLTAFVNICLYVPLFLCLRGNLKVGDDAVTPDSRARFRVQWQWLTHSRENLTWRDPEEKNLQRRVARQMLSYPIAYLFIILPISVTRWMGFQGKSVPYQATCFAAAIFSSSGLVNTTLYLITRPKLLRTLCGRRFDQNSQHVPNEAAGAPRRVEIPYADGDHRNDVGGRSWGLGMVTEKDDELEEESNVDTMGESPLRKTRRDMVVSGATFTSADSYSAGLSPPAFLSPGGSRSPSSSMSPSEGGFDRHGSSNPRATSDEYSGSWPTTTSRR